MANGYTTNLTATGTAATQATDGSCSGTLTETASAATTGATFEGAPALSAVTNLTLSFSNCTPASSSGTATDFYDSNYVPLGSSSPSGDYGVFVTAPVIPDSVRVGDSGNIGTITQYTDSTKTVGDGRTEFSFVIEPDTAETAIVNLIARSYDAASQLMSTGQDRYRITASGAMTAASIDVQFSTTSTRRLVFR